MTRQEFERRFRARIVERLTPEWSERAARRALLRYVAELLRVVEDYAGACARCQGRGEYPYDTVTGDRKGRPCADCADIREVLPG